MKTTAILFLIFISVSIYSQNDPPANIKILKLDSIFASYKGTFVLYDPANQKYQVYNEQRAKERFPAHSTLKLALAAVALKQQIVKGENEIVRWDSTKHPKQKGWKGYPMDHWAMDQSIVTAVRYSVNWYFVDLVKKMNMPDTRDRLLKYNYGQLPDTLYPFYFAMSCKIYTSAYDQINFLDKLYSKQLDLSTREYAILKKGLYYATQKDATLYSKSGGGKLNDGNNIGWNVGFVERNGRVYFYALNIEARGMDTVADLRYKLAWKILKQLGIIG